MKKYFCVFCKEEFSNQNAVYWHIRMHMRTTEFCPNCDLNKPCQINHQKVEVNEIVDTWLDSFLSFQEELLRLNINKLFLTNVKEYRLFLGCPMCDIIIKGCNIQYTLPSSSVVYNKMSHCSVHLRYYPFKCKLCSTVGRQKQFPDEKAMYRHVQLNHQIGEQGYEAHRIPKIEQFLRFYLSKRQMTRIQPLPQDVPKFPVQSQSNSARERKPRQRNLSNKNVLPLGFNYASVIKQVMKKVEPIVDDAFRQSTPDDESHHCHSQQDRKQMNQVPVPCSGPNPLFLNPVPFYINESLNPSPPLFATKTLTLDSEETQYPIQVPSPFENELGTNFLNNNMASCDYVTALPTTSYYVVESLNKQSLQECMPSYTSCNDELDVIIDLSTKKYDNNKAACFEEEKNSTLSDPSKIDDVEILSPPVTMHKANFAYPVLYFEKTDL